MLSKFGTVTLTERIRVANYLGYLNRNDYPLAFRDMLSQLYSVIECPCDQSCMCKKHGCTEHLLRNESNPEEIESWYLSCFVDQKTRNTVSIRKETKRSKSAIQVLNYMHNNWDELKIPINKSLLCTDWDKHYLKPHYQYPAKLDSIYASKLLSLLNYDLFFPFDTGSINLLRKDYNSPSSYGALLESIREDLIKHLKSNHITIDEFRAYDDPQSIYSELRDESVYTPIGHVIDMLYLSL